LVVLGNIKAAVGDASVRGWRLASIYPKYAVGFEVGGAVPGLFRLKKQHCWIYGGRGGASCQGHSLLG